MKESNVNLAGVVYDDHGFTFVPDLITRFKPFPRGAAVIGGFFGDEGKGKEIDILAEQYKVQGYKLLSVRGQGSGNAGHTVVDRNGKKYDFHYLTSAGLSADVMLLGPGMLIDPIRLIEEIKKLPEDKQKIIYVAERAEFVCDMERAMDAWCENQRSKSGQKKIGTTKSGVGPGSGNRGYRVHLTFADILKKCMHNGKLNSKKLQHMLFENPLWPEEVKKEFYEKSEYFEKLIKAIESIQIVCSEDVIQSCRKEGDWAVLLEVSQAVGLDPLFGNGGHYCTSTPCTDIGGIVGSGLTMYDFPDGTTMVIKAYGSKVGGGPYITKFQPDEMHIDQFIDDMVGEHGVTTGRKRDLGWIDGPAIRHSIQLTGAKNICINCMDVIVELPKVTDYVKVCFAYLKKDTDDEITYSWPYHLDDYEPLFVTLPLKLEDGTVKPKEQILAEYICLVEEVIGQKISGYGVGPSRAGYRERSEAFK